MEKLRLDRRRWRPVTILCCVYIEGEDCGWCYFSLLALRSPVEPHYASPEPRNMKRKYASKNYCWYNGPVCRVCPILFERVRKSEDAVEKNSGHKENDGENDVVPEVRV